MSSTQFNHETVVALYRFAFLLEGDSRAAGQALVAVVSEFAPQLEQIRREKDRTVFVLRKLRERCMKNENKPAPPNSESSAEDNASNAFARAFSTMPEPARSAIALFYLDLFPVRELAAALALNLDDFSDALESGREFLRRAGAPSVEPV